MSDDPAWKIREKVVTVIERHIGQSARIRHDVDLPVLTSRSGRTRQCDIVIQEGEKPRQTTSIVEVQKRRSKPEINDFNGWIEKMREVGAQHLICVSELGFPASIKEKADEIGPTVRLLTLQQIEQNYWPIPPTWWSQRLQNVYYDELLGLQMQYEHLVRINPNVDSQLPDKNEKIFRCENGHMVSVTDLLDWHLFSNPSNINELPENQKFTLGMNLSGYLEHKLGNNWIRLKHLLVNVNMFISSEILELEANMYEQIEWGELAWVLRAKAKVEGKMFDVLIPLKRVAPGEYRMGRPITMSDHDTFISIGGQGYRAERYSD